MAFLFKQILPRLDYNSHFAAWNRALRNDTILERMFPNFSSLLYLFILSLFVYPIFVIYVLSSNHPPYKCMEIAAISISNWIVAELKCFFYFIYLFILICINLWIRQSLHRCWTSSTKFQQLAYEIREIRLVKRRDSTSCIVEVEWHVNEKTQDRDRVGDICKTLQKIALYESESVFIKVYSWRMNI